MTRSFVGLLAVSMLAALSSFPGCDVPHLDAKHSLVQRIEATRCSVELSSLDYDTPGTDTSEFVVLAITAPRGDGGALTLGDCGVESLELLNGADDCAVYRTIALRDVPVPEAGFLAVCSDGASLPFACNVSMAESGPLRAGWLQNGPDDGLRITGDGPVRQYIYDARGASCVASEAIVLPRDANEASGGGNVVARCDGAFQLVSSDAVGANLAPRCPSAETTSAAGATQFGERAGAEATRVAEPSTARDVVVSGTQGVSSAADGGAELGGPGTFTLVGAPSVVGPTLSEPAATDASVDVPVDEGSRAQRPPRLGCATSRAGHTGAGGWLWSWLFVRWVRRRRRWRKGRYATALADVSSVSRASSSALALRSDRAFASSLTLTLTRRETPGSPIVTP